MTEIVLVPLCLFLMAWTAWNLKSAYFSGVVGAQYVGDVAKEKSPVLFWIAVIWNVIFFAGSVLLIIDKIGL